ncbi:uncharacterized protein [Ptychodera flava]|uniref:uncharacterized protein isoform X2 n=1 Tax=Ptychodera flava TaxID=63121 RepID=UPI00396A6C7C
MSQAIRIRERTKSWAYGLPSTDQGRHESHKQWGSESSLYPRTSSSSGTFNSKESHKQWGSDSSLYPRTSSSSGTFNSKECLTSEGTSSSSSGQSNDSYVYNKRERVGVHVFYAEKDERLVEDNIIKRLERQNIEYYFAPRDRLPGRSRKQTIRNAVRVHPVTLLAITANFNSEFQDEDLRDLIFYKRKVDLDRFVCVKLTKSAAIPTLFSDLGCVDLTKKLMECENEVDKMVRVSKKKIRRFLKKQKSGKENYPARKSERDTSWLDYVEDEIQHRKDLNDGDGDISFLCVRSLAVQAFGLHIRKDLLDDIGKDYSELGLDKHFDQSQGIQNLQDLVSRLHDERPQEPKRVTSMEHYLISNVLPIAESNGDIHSLSNMSTMFTDKFQSKVLRTLHNYHFLNVPRLEDAVASERILRSSMNTKSMHGCLRVLAYCDVLCNIVLAYCTSGTSIGGLDVDVTSVEKCLPGIQIHKSVAEELAYDYSKQMIRYAKDFIGKIKKGKLDRVFPFSRHGISKFSEVVRSIQAMPKDEFQNVSGTVASLFRKLNKFSKFEQLLALKYFACLIHSSDKSNLLPIFQRLLYRMKEETSQVFVFHVSQLMLQLIQSSVDEGLCTSLVRSYEENTLSLHALWSFKVVSNFSKCKDYLRESMQPLLRHISPTVRIETARKLLLNGKGLLAVGSSQEADKNHIIEIFTQNGLAMELPSIPKVYTPNPTYSTWSGTFNHKRVKLLVQTPKSVEDIDNDANSSSKTEALFNQEVQFLRETTINSNIVDLLGYQCQPSPRFIITEEWKETVSEYLLKQSRAGVFRDVIELIELFLLPMLSAVIFCHKRKIILRDIVANNFFVHHQHQKPMVKYFNFQLAKRQRPRESTEPNDSAIYEVITPDEIKGSNDDQIPTRYSAPESLLKNTYSTRSDAWMCTCLSYEVLTHGCQPYTELYGTLTEDVIQRVIHGYRIKQPPCIPDAVFMPMIGGVIIEPSRRTSVKNLCDSLQEFSDSFSGDKSEQKPLMIACKPPMRDTEQQSEPCRGIPRNLQTPNISSRKQSLYDNMHNVTYWLNGEEILGPDEPSISTDKKFFHERVLSERNPNDSEDIKFLTVHNNIGQVVNLFQDKEGITCQEYVNYGGEDLRQLCIEKHCGVDELLGYLRDTALAMSYIHKQGWVHACLKARYIMVIGGAVKVYRWGRAFRPEVLLYDRGPGDAIHTQKMPQDLLRWAPPEIILYGMFSQKGDVFMFAQVCWEAFNALAFDSKSAEEFFLPYPNKSAEQVSQTIKSRSGETTDRLPTRDTQKT